MVIEVGQQWSKKGKTYTVKEVVIQDRFTYIVTLRDDIVDTPDDRRVFGKSAFLEVFKFMKGGTDG